MTTSSQVPKGAKAHAKLAVAALFHPVAASLFGVAELAGVKVKGLWCCLIVAAKLEDGWPIATRQGRYVAHDGGRALKW